MNAIQQLKNRSWLLITMISFAIFWSCEKEEFAPAPEPDPNPVDTTGVQKPDTTETKPAYTTLSTPTVQFTSDFNSVELSMVSRDELNFGYVQNGPSGPHYYHTSAQNLPSGYEGVARWKNLGAGSNDFPHAYASDPANRPAYIRDATPNGLPALEFASFRSEGNYHSVDYNAFLQFDNRALQGDAFTLLAVISIPRRVVFYDQNGNFDQRPEKAQLLSGDQLSVHWTPWSQFSVQFPNDSYSVSVDESVFQSHFQDQFRVIAIRFSKEKGLTLFENGVPHFVRPTDPGFTDNSGLDLTGFLGATTNDRINILRVAELRIYPEAGTETAIAAATQELKTTYGIK